MRCTFAAFAVLAIGLLAGCTTASTDSAVKTASATSNPSLPSNVEMAFAGPASGDYRIGPLDILDISVFQVPDLSKTVQVSASGIIRYPLIGDLTAAGKTPASLESEIANKLGAKYLQSPQVSVSVKEATSKRVTVEGAVNKPGIYPLVGQTTLLQTIVQAGGLDRVADKRGIVVFRTIDGKRNAAKFDYAAIRDGKAEDPVLAGGDIIIVDESGSKAALRSVREAMGVFGLFSPFIL